MLLAFTARVFDELDPSVTWFWAGIRPVQHVIRSLIGLFELWKKSNWKCSDRAENPLLFCERKKERQSDFIFLVTLWRAPLVLFFSRWIALVVWTVVVILFIQFLRVLFIESCLCSWNNATNQTKALRGSSFVKGKTTKFLHFNLCNKDQISEPLGRKYYIDTWQSSWLFLFCLH